MLVRLLAYSTIGDGSLCQSASRRGVKISPTRLAKASSASPRGSFSAGASVAQPLRRTTWTATSGCPSEHRSPPTMRSEEHTSELQSLTNLVCRLLLEKKKKKQNK